MSNVRSIAGRQYELLFGSDVIRDGVFLELSELADGVRDIMAEAFFYDELGYVVFNAYRIRNTIPTNHVVVRCSTQRGLATR